mmetsp:Transcript_58131/g.138333  ORF Transcript_58131/g.138333 Transcript_58131/m.138333 type:complete len:85 (-) Transcript_58131:1793-2047(-)
MMWFKVTKIEGQSKGQLAGGHRQQWELLSLGSQWSMAAAVAAVQRKVAVRLQKFWKCCRLCRWTLKLCERHEMHLLGQMQMVRL